MRAELPPNADLYRGRGRRGGTQAHPAGVTPAIGALIPPRAGDLATRKRSDDARVRVAPAPAEGETGPIRRIGAGVPTRIGRIGPLPCSYGSTSAAQANQQPVRRRRRSGVGVRGQGSGVRGQGSGVRGQQTGRRRRPSAANGQRSAASRIASSVSASVLARAARLRARSAARFCSSGSSALTLRYSWRSAQPKPTKPSIANTNHCSA